MHVRITSLILVARNYGSPTFMHAEACSGPDPSPIK